MKTAVILAARRETDCDIPYPLLPFAAGECLLDRTLKILRDSGYDDILIVTGFRNELFEKYKAPDVRLVFNRDYEFTASMGSLALCKGKINSDFLLVESDTFFESIVIRRLSEINKGNVIAMTEESGSGDECFVETKNGFVTKITKDRHRVCNFEGEMIGVTRLSYDTFSKLVQAWEQSTNPYLNYEYLLMDVTDVLDRPVIKFSNLIWGDVDCQRISKTKERTLPYSSQERRPI